MTINIVNTSNSQTFPDINNDTTYLRQITVEEGARVEMPIYMDTTALNGFNEQLLWDNRYFNRFYSKYGIKMIFNSQYFKDNNPDTKQMNYNTNENEIIELFDKIKSIYGTFSLTSQYEGSSYNGKEFYVNFDSLINVISLYELLNQNKKETLRIAIYTNLPAIPVNSIEKNIDNLNLFPNPSSDYISLDLGGLEVADLSIYDMIGNKIMTIPNYSNKTEIDVSNLPTGTYFLNFNFQSYKFIKE